MTSYLPNGLSSGSAKLSDRNETSKGVVVPLYNSKEEMEGALDNTGHLRDWNFRGSKCDRCGLPNSKVDGLLIQCGLCKNAHYCSRRCFNDDLEYHQAQCQSASLVQQPTAGPDIVRRGEDDDDYEETEEQKLFIQKRQEKLSQERAAKEANETKPSLREPSPPTQEQKVRRSWDWDVLFGSSNGSTTNHSTTHHSITERELDEDDDSVHSFAPETNAEEEPLEAKTPDEPAAIDTEKSEDIELEDEEPARDEEPTDDADVAAEADASAIHPEESDDDEENRVRSKQQIVEEYDEEELERHRRRVTKILEVDAEHRRRLKIGDGDIPTYKWEPEHVKLTEAELIKRIYGWEVPEWVKNRMLRQTDLDKLEQPKPKTFSQTPVWATQPPLKRRSTLSHEDVVEKKEPVWAKKVPLRSISDDGTRSMPCFNMNVSEGDVAREPSLVHQFSQSLDLSQSPRRGNRRASCTQLDLSLKPAFGTKPQWATKHRGMGNDASGSLEQAMAAGQNGVDAEPALPQSPNRSSRRSYSQVPSWVNTSPLRRKSGIPSEETPPKWTNHLPAGETIVHNGSEVVTLPVIGSGKNVKEDASPKEALFVVAGASTSPKATRTADGSAVSETSSRVIGSVGAELTVNQGGRGLCGPSSAEHMLQATHESNSTLPAKTHVQSPKKTKTFSQTPSWAVQSPLKRRSLAHQEPKTVESKAPEWIARPPLRSKSEDGQGLAGMSVPSLDG